jgi:hypothetical protein
MSDNVGLATPRGSGTSGYVQRNLAHMRPRDMAAPYLPPRDGKDDLRHRPRQPDQGLLEHDRKREVEVKVFELRDKLEEEGCVSPFSFSLSLRLCFLVMRGFNKPSVLGGVCGVANLGCGYRVEENEIETRCDELRAKLLAEMEERKKNAGRDGNDSRRRNGGGGVGPAPRRNFKMHQVHELADAKIKESERLRQALKISKDYEEGSHWRRQDERQKKAAEREADGVKEEVRDDKDRERERERERDRDGY